MLCVDPAYNLEGKEGIMNERSGCCRYEPSLEDLLADEVMTPVLRSAGLEPQELRAMMVETARRIEHRERRDDDEEEAERESESWSGGECWEFEPDA
jgi:hypothetical protein